MPLPTRIETNAAIQRLVESHDRAAVLRASATLIAFAHALPTGLAYVCERDESGVSMYLAQKCEERVGKWRVTKVAKGVLEFFSSPTLEPLRPRYRLYYDEATRNVIDLGVVRSRKRFTFPIARFFVYRYRYVSRLNRGSVKNLGHQFFFER